MCIVLYSIVCVLLWAKLFEINTMNELQSNAISELQLHVEIWWSITITE